MPAKKIVVDLEADGSKFASTFEKSKGEIDRYVSHVNEQKSKATEGGGFGASLRAQAMEERQNGSRQIKALLMGGSIGMGGMLTEVINETAKKWHEAVSQVRESGGGFGDLADKIADGLPIIGQMWQAAKNLTHTFQDGAALAAEWLGYDQQTVQALESEATAHERILEVSKQRLAVQAQITAAVRATDLTGLKGRAKIEAEHYNALDDIDKKREELKATKGYKKASPAGRKIMMEGLDNALTAQEMARYKQALKDNEEEIDKAVDGFRKHKQQKEATLDEARNRLSEMKEDVAAAQKHNAGDEDQGNAAVEKSLREQIDSIRKWSEEQKKAYPEAIDEISDLEASMQDLAYQQAELARQKPLIDALRQVNEELAGTGFKSAIDRRIEELRKLHASEQQLSRARMELQIVEDRNAAKSIIESTRTPLEKLMKTKRELDRMREEEAINGDEYNRALGDAAAEARRALGLGANASPGPAEERRQSFTYFESPQSADPLDKLFRVQTDTLKESRKQTQLLEAGSAADVLKVLRIQ